MFHTNNFFGIEQKKTLRASKVFYLIARKFLPMMRDFCRTQKSCLRDTAPQHCAPTTVAPQESPGSIPSCLCPHAQEDGSDRQSCRRYSDSENPCALGSSDRRVCGHCYRARLPCRAKNLH